MSLVQVVSEVKERINSAVCVSLFLDFDGTLVPIEADPGSPRLDPATAETLRLISDRDFLVTTIISGRAVEDLYTRIRLDGLIYAGNHGHEIFGRNLRFVEAIASSRSKELEQLCEQLAIQLRPIAGVIVEFKGLTASIHYRQAAESRHRVEKAVRMAIASTGGLFRLNAGRKVFEIMPRTGWHKGAAVQWVNSHLQGEVLSVYLGDDTTDEEAFRVLPDAITIKVGGAVTCARYQLPNPTAVHEFLLWLAVHEGSRRRA
jgi:trehalose 6-phosphate phosphatase